jgi:curved DNA-binding protein CbpA
MTEDFYDLFELPPDATEDELREAYRRQVRIYHPDRNDDPRARAQFTAIKTAYDVLSEPAERQAHDRLGHETYVARRTSGLPSPDAWQSHEPPAADANATSTTDTKRVSTAGSTTSSSSGATGPRGRTSTADRTERSDPSRSTGDPADGHVADRSGVHERDDEREQAAVLRWWRQRNQSLALLWLSLAVYVLGVGQFIGANADGIDRVRAELSAAGGDLGSLLAVLVGGRYGVETSAEFVAGSGVLWMALDPVQAAGAFAGFVGLAVAAVLEARLGRAGDLRGPLTVDETVVLTLVVGAATGPAGGPLLAGAALMPFLFGTVVAHTRRGAGWTPSVSYVYPALAPATGFAILLAGYDALGVDFVALVFVPVVGGLWLPLRAWRG